MKSLVRKRRGEALEARCEKGITVIASDLIDITGEIFDQSDNCGHEGGQWLLTSVCSKGKGKVRTPLSLGAGSADISFGMPWISWLVDLVG